MLCGSVVRAPSIGAMARYPSTFVVEYFLTEISCVQAECHKSTAYS